MGQGVLAAPAQSGINIPEHAVKGVTLPTQQAVSVQVSNELHLMGEAHGGKYFTEAGKKRVLPAPSA